jgi:hypothetical protein
MMVNTITSLKALAQKAPKASTMPTNRAPMQRAGVTRQAGNDRGDKTLEANQETGVVKDRGRRPDQQS